jgi:hypothetical protein
MNLPVLGRKILSFCDNEYFLKGIRYAIIAVEAHTPKTLTIDASAYDKWTYVSFEQGKVVEVANYKNDLSWDIAFHRTDVRLNGGASGKGKGAVLETNATELNSVTVIPTTGYITDVIDYIHVSMMKKIEASKNLKLCTWVNKTGMPPSYKIGKKVYIVRTATGKHVKIKFLNYLNADNKGGHIKFTYMYMD